MNDETLSWGQDLPAELRDIVGHKGWASPADAIRSYAHLEKFVGSERLAVPSADAPEEEWQLFWQKTGRPEKADQYDLGDQEGEADWVRQTAFALGLNQRQAELLHQALQEKMRQAPAIEDGEEAVPAANLEEALRTLWGDRFNQQSEAARRGFRQLFASEEEFRHFLNAAGLEPTFTLLARAGDNMKEDQLIGGQGRALARNPAAAKAEIARLQQEAIADRRHPYVNIAHPDHQASVARMRQLFAIAFND